MTVRRWLILVSLGGAVVSGGAWAAENTVSQKDKSFDPEELTVAVGSSLHISNDDDVTHNVQVWNPDGENENLGVQKAGEAVDVPFPKVGDYTVHCGIHPKMKLMVHAQ